MKLKKNCIHRTQTHIIQNNSWQCFSAMMDQKNSNDLSNLCPSYGHWDKISDHYLKNTIVVLFLLFCCIYSLQYFTEISNSATLFVYFVSRLQWIFKNVVFLINWWSIFWWTKNRRFNREYYLQSVDWFLRIISLNSTKKFIIIFFLYYYYYDVTLNILIICVSAQTWYHYRKFALNYTYRIRKKD